MKKLGIANAIMLLLCILIILIAEYLFLTGNKLHGIFLGLWAPTLLGVMIFLKIIKNERG
jgi:K+ transporter